MEGSIPDFKEKTFCHSFGMPIRNEATVDIFLMKQLMTRKKGVESFYFKQHLYVSEKNHYVEVPAGHSSSSQCQLSKCAKSILKSEGDECERAKRVLKSVSTEHTDVFHSFLQ